MNWHIFERVTTKLGAVGLLSVGGLFATVENWLDLAAQVEPQWWVVIWMAGITFVMVRWMARYGKNLQRTPNGEISRLRQELYTERKLRRKLDDRIDAACEKLARIEGDLHGLTEVDE